MGKINQAWHANHRMPEKPTDAQRIAWHEAHALNCSCRPMPKRIAGLIKTGSTAAKRPKPD